MFLLDRSHVWTFNSWRLIFNCSFSWKHIQPSTSNTLKDLFCWKYLFLECPGWTRPHVNTGKLLCFIKHFLYIHLTCHDKPGYRYIYNYESGNHDIHPLWYFLVDLPMPATSSERHKSSTTSIERMLMVMQSYFQTLSYRFKLLEIFTRW